MSFGKVFRVFEKSSGQPYSIILEQRQQDTALLFESNAIAVLSTEELDAVKKQYSKLQDAYGCLGILEFSVGDCVVPFLVTVTACVSVGKINDVEIYRITQTSFISLRNFSQDDELVADIKKLLNSGTFYFSRSTSGCCSSFDLTLCAQRQRQSAPTDNRFFWNRMLHIHFIRFDVDTATWLLKIMCGNVEIRTVYIRHKQARAVIISRLSCERAGTRFNVRGCNDDGHVANFVETEQVIYMDDNVTSYIQTRGSVPLFWEQPGVQVGSHKVKLSRGPEASFSAYDKHFKMLESRYGRVAIINLLSSSLVGSREGEAALSQVFQNHHNASKYGISVPHIIFDYHAEIRSGNNKNLSKLREQIEKHLRKYDLFFTQGNNNAGSIVSEQKGVFRTNCLDCLDRTNCVQTYIGLEILPSQLKLIIDADSQVQMLSRFEEVFRQMWVNNGNEVSKMYAGTGAIQGGSKLMDGARSAARTIQNNLLDSSKQEAIDILLTGNTLNSDLLDRARMLLPAENLHASVDILREMCTRYGEYTRLTKLRVAVGTYNVNGGKHFRSIAHKDLSLSDWLLDPIVGAKNKNLMDACVTEDDEIPVDIFAIGFEEIVDLNASNIMAASSENAVQWASELQKVLCRDHSYVQLTYVQLVGVCLYVFVRSNLVERIKDVAVDSVKTGLGGATGNKGAVAIRFVLDATSFCFVCSHFAAGQSQVAERNADHAEITKKIMFPMGRTLLSHDWVFWCGDFNYRIDMEKETLKEMIRNNMLDEVVQYDQLTVQKREKNVFDEYSEGDVSKFAPTYKYDLFSDDYDTSDKCRAPAWTDRVLWRRRKMFADEDQLDDWNGGRLIHYGRAELKQSDHRPVIAMLEVDVRYVDVEERGRVFDDVLQKVGPLDGTIVLRTEDEETNVAAFISDDFMNDLLENLSLFGAIILVRFVENTMWVTFNNGVSALQAVRSPYLEIHSFKFVLSLKSPDWVQQTWKEINVCTNNTTPLYRRRGSGQRSQENDNDDDDDDDENRDDDDDRVERNSPAIVNDRLSKTSPIPSRPPAPVTRPKAGVYSIPTNLHQPLQPTAVVSEPRVPLRSAPSPPVKPSPPIPQRNKNAVAATSPQNDAFAAVVECGSMPPSEPPPPVPARAPPPLPPR